MLHRKRENYGRMYRQEGGLISPFDIMYNGRKPKI
jgi:hypothetical protein